jgi:hypothetical protein
MPTAVLVKEVSNHQYHVNNPTAARKNCRAALCELGTTGAQIRTH